MLVQFGTAHKIYVVVDNLARGAVHRWSRRGFRAPVPAGDIAPNTGRLGWTNRTRASNLLLTRCRSNARKSTVVGYRESQEVLAMPRILLMDDQPDVRAVVALALRVKGFDVVGFARGAGG